jgi:hypothetical protein
MMSPPPSLDWSLYGPTLFVRDLAEIFGLSAITIQRAVKHGDESLPQPFADRPWRWRKSDVRLRYERLTVRDVRVARSKRRRQLKEAVTA